MTATAGHVFVSHSSENRELANELAAFIEARGMKVWIAPRDVRPGMDYSEELQLAIESCVAFLVLVTEMANKSPYVRAETEMAFSTHKPIFPIRISDIQPAAGLALFLKIRHWTDAYGPGKSDSLERLTRQLQALSASAAATAAPAAPAPSPAAGPAVPASPAPPPPQQAPAAAAAPPAPPPPAPPPAPLSAEQEELWRAAVGPNADYYLDRWRQMDAKGSAISWNWPACIFNLFWFAYRKMWLAMGVLFAVLLVLGLLGGASTTMARITMFLTIAISFVTGAFGNHLYRKQVAKLVAQAPAGPDRQAALEQLYARGGVSMPALVISLAIVVLLTVLMVAAAMIAFQQQGDIGNGSGIQGEFGPAGSIGGADPGGGVSGEISDGGDGGVSGEIGGEIGGGGSSDSSGAAASGEGDKPTE